MSLKHREDSITGIRLKEAQKTKTATSASLVGGSIVVELPEGGVCSCTTVKFKAPCDCSAVTGGLDIDGVTYTLVDALGNCITGVGGYWATNANIAVMIDKDNAKAYVLNAAGSNLDGKAVMKAGDTMIGELRAGVQTPGEYVVRNEKISFTEETPKVNGAICWLAE